MGRSRFNRVAHHAELVKVAEQAIPTDSTMTGALREQRRILRDGVVLKGGTRCECCERHDEIYARRITGTIARALYALAVYCPRDENGKPEFARVTALLRQHTTQQYGTDYEQARWWNLVEFDPTPREDGGKAGIARLTHDGELYVRDRLKITEFALVYCTKAYAYVGEKIGIRDAVGVEFSLEALRGGTDWGDNLA